MAIFKDGVTVDETTGKVLAVGDKTAQFNPQVDATTNTSAVTPNLSLADAQAQASNILGANSGLVSPMSLTDIRAQEAEQKRVAQQGAEAQYNPQIAREEKMGATTLSTAEGALGQRQGFNLSSAESAYIASVQSDVAQRIKEVEDQKAAAISTGNFNATTWADTQLQKLNEYNNNLLLKKADLAMNLISQNQAQQQIDLSREQQAFNQDVAQKNLALSVAQLTGEYEGSPTLQATQNKISNALAEANLTGYYNGQKTLDAITSEAQQKLQQEGINIQKDQLAETIRSNKAQEGLSAARLKSDSAGKVTKTATDVTKETVARLVNLRNSGQLNDLNYAAETKILADALGYDADSMGALQSMVNQAMNGNTSAQNALYSQANQAMGSDFIVSSPADNKKNIINEFNSLAQSMMPKGQKPDLAAKAAARDILIKEGKYNKQEVISATGNLIDKLSSAIGLN